MKKSNRIHNGILALLADHLKLTLSIIVFTITAAAITIWLNRDNTIEIANSNNDIEVSTIQINSIRNIGEWEFLSINDEEIVDTISHGFFGDDELARIYYGTVRLGINLKDASYDWIKTANDTIIVSLPKIKILDEDFIDETRTRSFYSEGKWTASDYKRMYDKAYHKIRQRCVNEANIRSAERNGEEQFANLLHSMGYKNIRIVWEK